jgi:hypothetical protein
MQLTDKPGRLLIRKTPRFHWFLGALLAGVGGFCALVALGLANDGRTYSLLVRIGIGLFGGIAAAAGAWICWRAPLSTLVVDRARRTVTITRRGLFNKTTEQYPTTAIDDVRVTKERDGKGAPVYRVELVLVSGNVVPVSLIGPHDREGCMQAAKRLWVALGLPRV